jgi:hypothetical protein
MYTCTFEHVLGTTFDLALVSSTAAPQYTHTLMHSCGRTYPVSSNTEPFCTICTRHKCGRMNLCTFECTRAEPFQDLFLGHFSPFPSFSCSSRTLLPLSSPSFPPNHSLISKNHRHPPQTHHPRTTASLSPAISPNAGRPFAHFPHFLPIFPETPFFQNPSFFFFIFFIDCGHKSTLGLCPIGLLLVVICFYRGLGLFGSGFQTLCSWGAHQVFDKKPQPTSTMPRGQGSSSRSTGTQSMVARHPIESRKLLLENTIAIKEEFSNNETTSWAVQELKNRDLKRLFKPVASTTYERLVREFYDNLRCECD